jgi:hypothetical protein
MTSELFYVKGFSTSAEGLLGSILTFVVLLLPSLPIPVSSRVNTSKLSCNVNLSFHWA